MSIKALETALTAVSPFYSEDGSDRNLHKPTTRIFM